MTSISPVSSPGGVLHNDLTNLAAVTKVCKLPSGLVTGAQHVALVQILMDDWLLMRVCQG